MKLAAKRLEGIGWLALVLLVAILLYPLSLSVATLRSDLSRTEAKIVSVKKDIRYLETEFSARANLRQLEDWNKLQYGYAAPKASQYLDGERALANLGSDNLRSPVKVAVISSMKGVKPAGIIGSVFPSAAAQTPTRDNMGDNMTAQTTASENTATGSLAAVAVTALADRGQGEEPDAETLLKNRTERVASIESKLLDDGLMRDLSKKADVEKRRSDGG